MTTEIIIEKLVHIRMKLDRIDPWDGEDEVEEDKIEVRDLINKLIEDIGQCKPK